MTKARTNIEFMIQLIWKNGGIIAALRKGYEDNSPKKKKSSIWITYE